MNNLLALLAMLAMDQQQAQGKDKPIDYDHPLVEGEPIAPCCDKMKIVDVEPQPCLCADRRHQGAVFHSRNCDCPDRFMPMKSLAQPPEITWTDGRKDIVTEIARDAQVRDEPAPPQEASRMKRLGLDNPN